LLTIVRKSLKLHFELCILGDVLNLKLLQSWDIAIQDLTPHAMILFQRLKQTSYGRSIAWSECASRINLINTLINKVIINLEENDLVI